MNILMPSDRGKYIYHFTKCKTALKHILPSRKLKLSSFLNSNDPKENKTFGYWTIFQNCDDLKQFNIKKDFKKYLKSCKHLCFSQDYKINKFDVHGFKHPTMWAHYADKSRGVCIVIDKNKFIYQNPNLLNGPIKYSPTLSFPPIEYLKWERDRNSYFKHYFNNNAKKLFFQKYYHWNYEHEFKFLDFGSQEYCSIEDSLYGIYLGPDFNESLIESVLKLMDNDNSKVDKVTINDGNLSALSLTYFQS